MIIVLSVSDQQVLEVIVRRIQGCWLEFQVMFKSDVLEVGVLSIILYDVLAVI